MSIIGKIILILLILVILAVFALLSLLCYQYTKTTNVRYFILNSVYWCFATVNYEYFMAKADNISYDDFVLDFSRMYLEPNTFFHKIFLTEDRRTLFVMLLSQQSFIESNFGTMPFTTKDSEKVFENWLEHKKNVALQQEIMDSQLPEDWKELALNIISVYGTDNELAVDAGSNDVFKFIVIDEDIYFRGIDESSVQPVKMSDLSEEGRKQAFFILRDFAGSKE